MCLWALEISFPHPVKPGETVQAMLEEPEFYQELRDLSISGWEKGADT
jgi:acyl dehydratase